MNAKSLGESRTHFMLLNCTTPLLQGPYPIFWCGLPLVLHHRIEEMHCYTLAYSERIMAELQRRGCIYRELCINLKMSLVQAQIGKLN